MPKRKVDLRWVIDLLKWEIIENNQMCGDKDLNEAKREHIKSFKQAIRILEEKK